MDKCAHCQSELGNSRHWYDGKWYHPTCSPLTSAAASQARIAALEAQLAEAKAALHIATNDKLSLLDHLDTERQRRMAQIDYSCDLQRIIEDLCRGGPVREPKTSARHHYDMATAFLSALEATPPAPMVTEAWQVKDYADGWIDFATAEEALAEVRVMGSALIRPTLTAAQEEEY